ncbi:LPP20 family lipoprotein [Photobacterium atrarenae]|uniref:LPP20 family lipoprotein n=1 Tax=Photobacterium atrarenae TaxID=865757 RepID=A0ABY5GGQ0_9GAMM|nr:LPP20 family lipoprotein [Photobacterium atrarenae]UTV28414.1 LPP20 family lipoprotein [Photobacterium atrarenae]
MKMKAILALSGALMLSACQSTSTPEWVLTPTQETNQQLYAVGHGGSLSAAQRMAMSQLNERLWTQVESSGYQRQVLRELNGDENFQSINDSRVNVKTAPVVLTGVDYPRQQQVDGIYYVEATINKATVKTQLQRELTQTAEDVKTALLSRDHADPLLWWLKHRDVQAVKDKVLTRQAMLLAVSDGVAQAHPVTEQVIALERTLQAVKNQLQFKVVAPKGDRWMKGFVEQHLAAEHIATGSSTSKATHILNLDTEWRQSKVGDAYISTVIADLTIQNKRGKTTANREVIASGNSVSNYKVSKEGASRHFSAQMSEQGLWHFLGVL